MQYQLKPETTEYGKLFHIEIILFVQLNFQIYLLVADDVDSIHLLHVLSENELKLYIAGQNCLVLNE